jgi:hypothetical protein
MLVEPIYTSDYARIQIQQVGGYGLKSQQLKQVNSPTLWHLSL